MRTDTTKIFKILFVDDEEINVFNFQLIFQDKYEIITAYSGEEGLRLFQESSDIGLIVSDQRMPGISGTDMLSRMYEIDPDPIRVLLTAHSQVEDIMDAINLGRIYQYILKPWDTGDMEMFIDRAKALYQLKKENISLTNELADKNRNLESNIQKLGLSEKRLGDLSAMLITAQDNERRRLAMELHDEFGQSLAALKLQLRALENEVHSSEDSYKELIVAGLQELRLYVNQQIGYVRTLSQELWPMIVDDLGVDVAFDTLIGGFLGSSDIEIDINVESIGRFFPVEKQRHLYRLLQESLNNVVKHAHATRIQIQAGQMEDDVILAVHDNGSGFDVDVVSQYTGKTRGIGLQSMDERAKLMDGKMKINSRPGMGTSIIFTLPKDESANGRL
jgi:signal transduction histidine kinase